MIPRTGDKVKVFWWTKKEWQCVDPFDRLKHRRLHNEVDNLRKIYGDWIPRSEPLEEWEKRYLQEGREFTVIGRSSTSVTVQNGQEGLVVPFTNIEIVA